MDFRELEYFVTIARKKNLTNAAQLLYVSQPALSKYLQKLEEEHGLPLFQRVGKQLQLTYAGERYLSYANEILSLNHSMKQEMMDIRKQNIGILHVGMPPLRCSISLPTVLPKFHKEFPDVQVEIVDNYSSQLDIALMEGQLDLAFYNLFDFRDGLDYKIINQEYFSAIFPKKHPIRNRAVKNSFGEDGIYLSWLQDEVLLLQDRNQRHGDFMYRALAEKNITNFNIQRSSSVGAALALASNGYGVSFLSSGLLRYYRSIYSFDSYRLLDVNTPAYFAAAWKKNRYLPGYATRFIEIVQELEMDQI